ncbi:MAG: SAM-dependent DNA methyltransferase [Tatlockia sp.]|nr:SAM-dependent DNA methyltransferase [Tatlockia sp.]
MKTNEFNVQRVEHNLQALAELKSKNPNPEILKQYSGWGGLRNAIFTPDVYRVLKRHVSDEAISSIKKTITNAYYTPQELIRFIYDALALFKKPFSRVLEPSAGHGLFFELMPDTLNKAEHFAVEMDLVSARMLRCLYPNVQLYHGGFETYQPQIPFDLIVGNPPYGREVVADETHADISQLRIHHFFVAKCMRLLAPRGILAMVLPRYFLDNRKDHAREIIHQEGGSLLAAYRLPDNLFADAKVTVDLVFLIKEAGERDWLHFDKIKIDNEVSYINRYFSMNPSHIIGELAMIEAYGRPELTCRQSKREDTWSLLRQLLTQFPVRKLPTIEECKAELAQRLALLDKQIHALSMTKNQLLIAERDLQFLERQFLQQCVEKINFNALSQ